MSDPAPRTLSTRPLVAALIGVLALAVLVTGIVTAIARHGDGSTRHPATGPTGLPRPSPSTPPGDIVDGYYAALEGSDARTAYALLCDVQQAVGFGSYSAEVSQDAGTGTGITAWHRSGAAQVQGQAAQVQGSVSLHDGTSTPITVYLTLQPAGWRVCSSNLGGVLPGPGASAGPAPSSGAST